MRVVHPMNRHQTNSKILFVFVISFGLLASCRPAPQPRNYSVKVADSTTAADISVEEILAGTRLGTILRTDVAKQLDLSNYLKKKIRETFESNAKPPNGGGLPSFISDSMIKDVLRGKLAETEAKVLTLLSDARLARLEQLMNQLKGPAFLHEKETKRSLKLTRDQQRKFDSIRAKYEQLPGNTDGSEKQALVAVLTPKQSESLSKLLGPLEKFDPVAKYYVELPRIKR